VPSTSVVLELRSGAGPRLADFACCSADTAGESNYPLEASS
jgi:hypothetical protein